MKTVILAAGRIDQVYLREGILFYLNRLRHYTTIEITEVNLGKKDSKATEELIRQHESDLLLGKITPTDYVIILHEKGRQLRSVEFAAMLNEQLIRSTRRLVFVIGGAYGMSDKLMQRGDFTLSLSAMTLPHQLIRLVFLEQLYRGFSILRNEPYHNE